MKQAPAPRAYFNVPVFPGDTLATIADRYQVGVEELASLNNSKRNLRLNSGQIRVPVTTTRPRENTVASIRPAVARPPAAASMKAPAVASAQARPAPATQARPSPIERRSLAPLPAISTRTAGISAMMKEEKASPPAAEVATREPPPSADTSSWYDWFVPVTPPVAAPSDTEHRFLWPVEGEVISPFGNNPNGGRNDGINILAPRGTPIYAAEGGVVSYVGNELKGYGNLILVRHDNDFVTAYAHADSVHVKRGDRVERGQVIGSTGDTGDVSEPQLHFELRHGTTPVDPTPYLTAPTRPTPATSAKRLAEGTR